MWKEYIRSWECLQQITEGLAIAGVQESTKRPDEAEQVEALDVQLPADLDVVGQHGRQQTQTRLEHAHLRQPQARPEWLTHW